MVVTTWDFLLLSLTVRNLTVLGYMISGPAWAFQGRREAHLLLLMLTSLCYIVGARGCWVHCLQQA